MSWLHRGTGGIDCAEEAMVVNMLFKRWMFWLFACFISPILRAYFYCTETAVHQNRVFYYRKNVWSLIVQVATREFKANMLEPLSHVRSGVTGPSACVIERFAEGSKEDIGAPIVQLLVRPSRAEILWATADHKSQPPTTHWWVAAAVSESSFGKCFLRVHAREGSWSAMTMTLCRSVQFTVPS